MRYEAPVGAGNSQQRDFGGSGAAQRDGAGGGGGTGGHHVIDEKNSPAFERLRAAKGRGHIPAASGIAQPRLNGGRPHPAQGAYNGNSAAAGKESGQQFRLIEAALPAAAPVERHGHNRVEGIVGRERGAQHLAERARQGRDSPVFVEVNQLAEHAVVRTEAVGGVEAANTGAAERTAALIIQRKPVLEGRAASYAEELGAEGLGRAQAIAANRYSGNFGEGLAANPAIVWEEEGKKGVGDFSYYGRTNTRDCGSNATREDPPPQLPPGADSPGTYSIPL